MVKGPKTEDSVLTTLPFPLICQKLKIKIFLSTLMMSKALPTDLEEDMSIGKGTYNFQAVKCKSHIPFQRTTIKTECS